MDLIHKDDIEILDYIIKECLKDTVRYTSSNNLKELPNDSISKFKEGKRRDYYMYFKIIENYDIADLEFDADSLDIKPRFNITKRFYEKGGFKKVYEEQQEQIEFENKMKQKKVNEAKIVEYDSKKMRNKNRIYILTFIIGIVGLIGTAIGLYIAYKKL